MFPYSIEVLSIQYKLGVPLDHKGNMSLYYRYKRTLMHTVIDNVIYMFIIDSILSVFSKSDLYIL